jgi:hypothetical protein
MKEKASDADCADKAENADFRRRGCLQVRTDARRTSARFALIRLIRVNPRSSALIRVKKAFAGART